MAWLGYSTVGSNDLPRAVKYYDDQLGSAGLERQFDHPNGGRIYGKDGRFCFGVLGPFDKHAATPGNGAMVAFSLDSPARVDAFHAKALSLGGADEGAPGLRAPSFYFSYFRDLDGNKLCAFHITPEAAS
jgi:catechol 2,3-dioxygenase-like lactoylglutathione lyase family enzyme